ncbi:MAG: winged helix-turn-helix domain-containing protein [Fimbriimonadaceae bacterium]|nr:winged helix-turn-helix domain-containing protein [Fimbriimonadaceae bacterium]QYK55552.1 MAG: winged helix-turn-helix domain-containing protein [Fimbriimonadaceae bacterium]
MPYVFGEYRLDPARYELRGPEGTVGVEPQVFEVLCYLIQNRHRVVGKDELLTAVWGDTFVNEATLSGRIMAARRAIGDSGSRQCWIKTVHGRGFRFVGEVREGTSFPADDLEGALTGAQTAIESVDGRAAIEALEGCRVSVESDGPPELDALRADWHRLFAQALLLRDGWTSQEARRHCLEAIRLAEGVGAVDVFRAARYHLATIYELAGEYPESETLMRAAVTLASPEHVDVEASELLACSLFHQGRFRECVEQATVGASCELGPGDRRLSAFYGEHPGVGCHFWLALSLWFLGDEVEAHRQASAAIRRAEQPGAIYCLAHARQQAAMLHQLRGDAPLCEHWAGALQAIGRRQSLPYREAVAALLLGWARGAQADPSPELAVMREALEEIERSGVRMELAYFMSVLADSELASGRADRAAELLDRALKVSAGRGYFHRAETLRLRARATASLGLSGARECLEEALTVARGQDAEALVRRCEADVLALAASP